MPVRSSLCMMARMVREGEISPVELLRAHTAQIESQRERVNAFVRVLAYDAMEAARRAESAVAHGEPLGLLHGVPVTIKDSFDVAGHPTLCGSVARKGHCAARDSTVAARLRAEGAIILGKTNCPELLGSYETDNYITGRTNNPWDPERTPGGSSGGEAAAIASFCSAGGVGSDGGGSVRQPAHFCGICGLKPTPGRIGASGHFPNAMQPTAMLFSPGPMARTATDVRLLFAALAGYDPADALAAPVPLRTPQAAGTRIGLWEQFYQVPVDPEIQQAVREAGKTLEQLGFPVETFEPRGLERAPNLWWFFFGELPAPFTRQLLKGESEAHWTVTETLSRALDAPPASAEQVMLNLAARDAMRAGLLRQMEHTPVLLLPPCGTTAFPHRARRFRVGSQEIGLFQAMMPSTIFNLLGLPALVVPFTLSSGKLPIGIQLVGRPWEEELLLEIAIKLEEVRGSLI